MALPSITGINRQSTQAIIKRLQTNSQRVAYCSNPWFVFSSIQISSSVDPRYCNALCLGVLGTESTEESDRIDGAGGAFDQCLPNSRFERSMRSKSSFVRVPLRRGNQKNVRW